MWLEFSVKCGYLDRDIAGDLYGAYNGILKTLAGMAIHADSWTFKPEK